MGFPALSRGSFPAVYPKGQDVFPAIKSQAAFVTVASSCNELVRELVTRQVASALSSNSFALSSSASAGSTDMKFGEARYVIDALQSAFDIALQTVPGKA